MTIIPKKSERIFFFDTPFFIQKMKAENNPAFYDE